ncbi:CRISPR pre-crRNA endoribonuclease Cas5d [Dickeya dianthicola]|uniref:pre-crRNA processing endonuclease n=1 Tax=Dickeya dianthicola TaxID=204039 RepID=A0AAX1C7L7_9GAMM|nr:type I-C CRISPR-associated protein Cas5c [Dickeya dianthicola]ATO32437.1 CRISPR-associated protein, Cas5d family [Dickeya dianthicola RNS04.9]AYC18457.1 CRISPR pre-crRNA endoribonuclease Cas5d [Dickeya dianthicola]MBI0439443.1 type I-C CRISPR-associated protein Cas5 [Dickeya dianthicola]MBI0449823.1 type I-C CRISPR-associated protein Cas5 [Dickeya dianthicola]MBI0454982.1 type I-C CRISPR-associated protein Cas5 [Dickeya dianthicola]
MPFCLDVQGEFACFTRPEMKVERVSYDVITPSAARSIFDAILWKPAIAWRVTRIEVINPIRWINLRRNEVGSVISSRVVTSTMKAGSGTLGLYIEDDRQQRAGLFLRDVHYRLHGEFTLTAQAGRSDNAGKFAEMFRRRAQKGQCINQPYLGCREFAADVLLIDDGTPQPPALAQDRELGWMLYDMDYQQAQNPTPRFFHAAMTQGVIDIPAPDSPEVVA